MRTATLTRGPSTDDGTFGQLVLDDGTTFFTGELPWRDNKNGVSCIPVGSYVCTWAESPAHGMCYNITNVPGRSHCLIHSANFAGDTSIGKVSQLMGCIATGKSTGMLDPGNGKPQMAVLKSKVAIAEFENNMNEDDLTLIIQ